MQESKLYLTPSHSKQRFNVIVKFDSFYRLYSDNPEESIRLCQTLLEEPHLDVAIRMGDIYSLLIMHCSHHKDFKKVSLSCLHSSHHQSAWNHRIITSQWSRSE